MGSLHIKSKFENLGKVNQYGMNLNIYAVLFNFMEVESYLHLAYNSFEGRSDYDGLAYNGGISAYVPLPWDIDLEMTFIMASKVVDYNAYSTSNTIIDEFSISKSILNDNGAIGVSVWEPFFRARENEYIWSPSFSDESKWVQTNNTCIMLNFSYFINKGKKVKKSNKKLQMENYDRSHKR
ncbi:MAG: outer membrane beta-barrel protein [Bacteroidetes bacterium]|nr:outer membrane beta-barrel protein [Bacteroidota bacterium]